MIGDSFVFGTGVADKDTFSCAAKSLGVNLYTLGIPGANPSTYLNIAEKNKEKIKAKYHEKKAEYKRLKLEEDKKKSNILEALSPK